MLRVDHAEEDHRAARAPRPGPHGTPTKHSPPAAASPSTPTTSSPPGASVRSGSRAVGSARSAWASSRTCSCTPTCAAKASPPPWSLPRSPPPAGAAPLRCQSPRTRTTPRRPLYQRLGVPPVRHHPHLDRPNSDIAGGTRIQRSQELSARGSVGRRLNTTLSRRPPWKESDASWGRLSGLLQASEAAEPVVDYGQGGCFGGPQAALQPALRDGP